MNADGPVKIDVDAIEALLDRPEYRVVRSSLEEVGFGAGGFQAGNDIGGRVAVDMFATYAGQATDMKEWIDDAKSRGLINTDRNLRLQYVAGLWFNTYISGQILNNIMENYRFPTEIFSGSEPNLAAMKQVLRETGRRDRTPAAMTAPAPATRGAGGG